MSNALMRFAGEVAREVDRFAPTPDVAGLTVDEPGDYCWRCGATMAQEGVTGMGCAFCRDEQPAWDRMVRLGEYHSAWGEAIRSMKFGRRWVWARVMGQMLAERIGPWPPDAGPVVVTYVPMPRLRRWRRGFNQAQLIAHALARHQAWPVLPLLRRIGYHRPQTLVTPAQRHANVKNTIAPEPVDLAGWTVWLVDDVKTSGATLDLCAKHLQRMNARCVHVAVAAVADATGRKFTRL